MKIASVCVRDTSNQQFPNSHRNKKDHNHCLNKCLVNKILEGKQLNLLKKVAVLFSELNF
jgi:hypothetical protein